MADKETFVEHMLSNSKLICDLENDELVKWVQDKKTDQVYIDLLNKEIVRRITAKG